MIRRYIIFFQQYRVEATPYAESIGTARRQVYVMPSSSIIGYELHDPGLGYEMENPLLSHEVNTNSHSLSTQSIYCHLYIDGIYCVRDCVLVCLLTHPSLPALILDRSPSALLLVNPFPK